MKLNWDTVRRILLAVEALPDENSMIKSHKITGIDPVDAAYHMRLMRDAGLITGERIDSFGLPTWCYATGLTWDGHEFLGRIRSDTAWNRIKTAAREKDIPLGFDSIATLARWLIEQAL